MTEAPVDALRRRARSGLLESAERAPARAHFRAMGVDPARLGGPIIGVASTWTGTMPCNLNQRELADRVSEGVSAGGGLALGFNTIAVSDNQSQGTPGMRASLISREVIADSIELMVHAHEFDGLVCVVGCDKTVPAALMALARVDKPAVLVYNVPMRAGRWHEREVTIQDVWEAVAAEEHGLMSRDELDELERFACPGMGTCAGHFTANTMAVAIDCLGITCVGDALVPADEHELKRAAAARAGALAVQLVERGANARRFFTRPGLLNAMAGIAATGGSTNGVLHLLAIAREAGVALTPEELTDVAGRTPVIADLAPSGRWMAEDFQRAGGTRTLIRELIRGGRMDGSTPTVEGTTLAEATSDAPPPDGEVVYMLNEPFKPSGALHTLRGNLAPDGSLVKVSAT
ncbi:MAG: dihydroxy-acid dehydratase, partial [Gaiellaceae bacterium]